MIYNKLISGLFFRIIFESMKAAHPKIFRNQVIGFDSEKNAYATTSLFHESTTSPGKKFQVGKNTSCNFLSFSASEIFQNLCTILWINLL